METESEKTKKPSRKRYWLSLSLIVLLAVVLALSLYEKNKNSSPIPKNVRKQTNLVLYYPDSLPAGYHYQKGSATVANGILFFSLKQGSEVINISEQEAPKIHPDLDALQKYNTSFKKIDTTAGQAVVGLDPASQAPVAIIETSTTLINVSGAKDTPSDIISKLAQNLSSLPQ